MTLLGCVEDWPSGGGYSGVHENKWWLAGWAATPSRRQLPVELARPRPRAPTESQGATAARSVGVSKGDSRSQPGRPPIAVPRRCSAPAGVSPGSSQSPRPACRGRVGARSRSRPSRWQVFNVDTSQGPPVRPDTGCRPRQIRLPPPRRLSSTKPPPKLIATPVITTRFRTRCVSSTRNTSPSRGSALSCLTPAEQHLLSGHPPKPKLVATQKMVPK